MKRASIDCVLFLKLQLTTQNGERIESCSDAPCTENKSFFRCVVFTGERGEDSRLEKVQTGFRGIRIRGFFKNFSS